MNKKSWLDFEELYRFRRAPRIYHLTTNKAQFNKAQLMYYAVTGKISCGCCNYNRWENKKHGATSRSWKRYRKFQAKYRECIKECVYEKDY